MDIGKLMQVGNSVAVVIPAAYRRQLGMMLGDHVELGINNGLLVIRSLRKDAIKTRKTSSSRGANDLTKVTANLRKPRS